MLIKAGTRLAIFGDSKKKMENSWYLKNIFGAKIKLGAYPQDILKILKRTVLEMSID